MKKQGFTLAEVLITLGIIGIVAAMTIPQLIRNYRAAVLQSQFKKSYAVLSNAYLMTKNNLGVSNVREAFLANDRALAQIFIDEFYKNLQIKKTVRFYPITNYTGTKIATYDYGADYPKALRVLPDGSSIGVYINSGMIRFWVDTNGPYKKPNRYGFDIFEFQVRDKTDAILTVKPTKLYTEEELENQKYQGIAGYPCSLSAKTQDANGMGCSWYAVNDVCPDDKTKNYWKNLPK